MIVREVFREAGSLPQGNVISQPELSFGSHDLKPRSSIPGGACSLKGSWFG